MSHWAVGSLPRIDRRTASVQGRDDSEHYRCGATRVRDKWAVEGFQKAQYRGRGTVHWTVCVRVPALVGHTRGVVSPKAFPKGVSGCWKWATFLLQQDPQPQGHHS